MAQQGYEENLLRQWFPITRDDSGKHFTESDIRGIADVLKRSSRESWSRIPRIYSVLRRIGQTAAIDAFIDNDITDVAFPFSKNTLPEALRSHSARLEFLKIQHLVYNTEALNLERHARHGHFSDPAEVPLIRLGDLGKGGFGYVDHVVSTISHKEYARKLISRGRTFRKDRQILQAFVRELSNLKRLTHKHLVDLVGSYTDKKFVALIMLPVADCNMQAFLEKSDLDNRARSFLRPFFGCLTSALSYLHDNHIRHKDIKPSNVLVKHDQVYLTDFGTSLDWSELGNSTTATALPTTPRYCAPEVMAYVARNTSSDIWSLGCVFLEMWTVLKHRKLEDLKAHMVAHGTRLGDYHANLDGITTWVEVLECATGPGCDSFPSTWIVNMLQREPALRWSAHILADCIQEASTDPTAQYTFSGLCCLESYDDTSEYSEISQEDQKSYSTVKSRIHHNSTVKELAPNPETSNFHRIEHSGFMGPDRTSGKDQNSDPTLQTPSIVVSEAMFPSKSHVEEEEGAVKDSGGLDEATSNSYGLKPTTPTSLSPRQSTISPNKAEHRQDSTSRTSRSGSLSRCALCRTPRSQAGDSVKFPCSHRVGKACCLSSIEYRRGICPVCIVSKPSKQADRNFAPTRFRGEVERVKEQEHYRRKTRIHESPHEQFNQLESTNWKLHQADIALPKKPPNEVPVILRPSNPPENRGFPEDRRPEKSLNNPKLLETVEDAIRRIILPELDALKAENRISRHREKATSNTSKPTSFREQSQHVPTPLSASRDSKPKVILHRDGDNPKDILFSGSSRTGTQPLLSLYREIGAAYLDADSSQLNNSIIPSESMSSKRKKHNTYRLHKGDPNRTVRPETIKPYRKGVDDREGLEHMNSSVRSDSSDGDRVAGYTRHSAEGETQRKPAVETRRKAQPRRAFEDSGYNTRQRSMATQEENAIIIPHRSRRKADTDARLKPASSGGYLTVNREPNRSQDTSRRMRFEDVNSESDNHSMERDKGRQEADGQSRPGRSRRLSTGDSARFEPSGVQIKEKYGPEDVNWAPRGRVDEREYASKPSIGRQAIYVY